MQTKYPDSKTSEQTQNMLASTRQLLRLRVREVQYAVDLMFVACVLPLMELQQVSGSAHYLAGLMDYRGKSLPVVDLGIWLGLQPTESYNLDTPIIICKDGQQQTAFIVSDVMQVEVVDAASIQMQNTFEESDTLFEASLNLKASIVLLLDMKRILSINFTTTDSHIPAVTHLHPPRPSAVAR